MQSNSYRDLVVWQKAMDLVVAVYACTERFPQAEKYGLANQMQRAAVSIPSNIAEGQKRGSSKEFLQFLRVSYVSGAELETQLEICRRLSKLRDLDYTQTEALLEQVMKMLNVLVSSLKRRL